jgi:hypothetical protein
MRQGVTPIDQLMNLDNEDKSRDETLNKFRARSIRNSGDRGGMSSYEKVYNSAPPPPQVEVVRQIIEEEPQQEEYGQMRTRRDYVPPTERSDTRSRDRVFRESYGGDLSYGGSCIDVANHAYNCPVCSRLYNTDKTPHLVLIGLLVIICLILIKKVLEK